MRIESSVTSLSWIPSEAISGMSRLPFDMGVSHYDESPPEHIEDIEDLRRQDRFRFANHLNAWIEVEDGRIVGSGHSGGGLIGATTLRLGGRSMSVAAVAFPDRRPEPTVTDSSVRFIQTAGGRTGLPLPRKVKYPPFVQIQAPLAWTTLALTIHADGRVEKEVIGASTFPRHWIYDEHMRLVQKTGLIDWKSWTGKAFGSHTPWGDEDSPALVTEVETALEHELSAHFMRKGTRPDIRNLKIGHVLAAQGDPGEELFLLLDGVVSVEVDGELLAHLGPGVVLGERAVLESGRRTSSVKAVTAIRVAVIRPDEVEPSMLAELATHHRREEQ
ncbi:MAG TPA: cyclic nucleotide-binding domain-containing protein [Candidatus Dormibacteraeota bacterium]|nr:cyclic nucleotide-binding domain-containing protein [Candidatus Dormibacteraeota bacterium]